MTKGERQQFPTPRNYWMLALPLENYRITRDHGFTVQGFNTAQKKKTERMEIGDRLLYYLRDVRRFAATATIASKHFEEHTSLWKPETEGEVYPYRVHVVPQMVLEEADFLDALELAPRLEYVRKWPPEDWPLAFVGQLHLIPKRDFLLIEEEMRKILAARRRGPRHPPSDAHPTEARHGPPVRGEGASLREG